MFKIVFLGDSNVGKTCLAKLFADRRTLEQSTATIGFDYHTMDIRLEDGTNATVSLTNNLYKLEEMAEIYQSVNEVESLCAWATVRSYVHFVWHKLLLLCSVWWTIHWHSVWQHCMRCMPPGLKYGRMAHNSQ